MGIYHKTNQYKPFITRIDTQNFNSIERALNSSARFELCSVEEYVDMNKKKFDDLINFSESDTLIQNKSENYYKGKIYFATLIGEDIPSLAIHIESWKPLKTKVNAKPDDTLLNVKVSFFMLPLPKESVFFFVDVFVYLISGRSRHKYNATQLLIWSEVMQILRNYFTES
ncbi:MAG: hypothetical protein ABIK07_21245 [Planctomycetota bacterium]